MMDVVSKAGAMERDSGGRSGGSWVGDFRYEIINTFFFFESFKTKKTLRKETKNG